MSKVCVSKKILYPGTEYTCVPIKIKQTTINLTIANPEIYFLPTAYSKPPYKLECVTVYTTCTTCSRFSNVYDCKNTCLLFNGII
jgi:hypothetical protein